LTTRHDPLAGAQRVGELLGADLRRHRLGAEHRDDDPRRVDAAHDVAPPRHSRRDVVAVDVDVLAARLQRAHQRLDEHRVDAGVGDEGVVAPRLPIESARLHRDSAAPGRYQR
jgi:hypothetical protein